VPIPIFEALDQLAHGRRIARRSAGRVVNWRLGDGSRREQGLAGIVWQRHAEPRADRRRNEVNLGKTRATQEAVAADARAAGNADRRQEQIGDLAEQRPHWPAPSCCAGA